VGLSPKQFANISRFLSIHRAMSQKGLSDLIFLVLEFNYYDQPHFNREYKRITGLTPTSEVMSCFYKT
jgi:AraC-like DNA-binding protein